MKSNTSNEYVMESPFQTLRENLHLDFETMASCLNLTTKSYGLLENGQASFAPDVAQYLVDNGFVRKDDLTKFKRKQLLFTSFVERVNKLKYSEPTDAQQIQILTDMQVRKQT